jgi:hypothetical protein
MMHRILTSARDGAVKQGSRFAYRNADHVIAANHLTRPLQHLSRSSRCVSCRTAFHEHARVASRICRTGWPGATKVTYSFVVQESKETCKCKRAF